MQKSVLTLLSRQNEGQYLLLVSSAGTCQSYRAVWWFKKDARWVLIRHMTCLGIVMKMLLGPLLSIWTRDFLVVQSHVKAAPKQKQSRKLFQRKQKARKLLGPMNGYFNI